jgi:hypothetical protein
MMDRDMILEKGNYGLLGFSIGLGAIFDYLFNGKSLGFSMVLFVAFFYVFFFWSLRDKVKFPPRNVWLSKHLPFSWFLMFPISLLTITYVIYSNPILSFFNLFVIVLLMSVQTILLSDRNNHSWSSLRFLEDVLEYTILRTISHVKIPFFIATQLTRSRTEEGRFTFFKKIVKGLLISLPLLFVVLVLLSSADMVFQHILKNNFLQGISLSEFFLHMFVILLVSIFLFAYIWTLKYTNSIKPEVTIENPLPEVKKKVWEPVTVITILIMMNAVYILFSSVQFSYLFGGAQFLMPSSFSYSDYARQGFFELLVVTFINFSILLSTIHFVNKENKTLFNVVRGLLSLITLSTMIILYSAFFRLSLYEAAYGYTYLRFFAHYFMIFLSVLLLIVLWGIWQRKISLMKSFIVVSIIGYTVVNYVNVDVIIAKNNINRYYKTGEIDMYYLKQLSYDAIPELTRLANEDDQHVSETINRHLSEQKADLEEELRFWASYNYSKHRAINELK